MIPTYLGRFFRNSSGDLYGDGRVYTDYKDQQGNDTSRVVPVFLWVVGKKFFRSVLCKFIWKAFYILRI